MYCSSISGLLGSLVMPLRLSVLIWYWSMTQSRRAVAEAVFENFGRDFCERQRLVDLELGLVFRQPHFLDVVGERDAFGFDPLERPGFELFVVEMQLGQFLASLGESPKPTAGSLSLRERVRVRVFGCR